MRTSGGILRRHGLTVLIVAALVYVFGTATMPALQERSRARMDRLQAEAELERKRQLVEERALWLKGAQQDPMLRERLLDARERSPELTGPRFHEAPPAEDEPADSQ